MPASSKSTSLTCDPWTKLAEWLDGTPTIADPVLLSDSASLLDRWPSEEQDAALPVARRIDLLDRWAMRLQQLGANDLAQRATEISLALKPDAPVATARWIELQLSQGADPATLEPRMNAALAAHSKALPLLAARALLLEHTKGGAAAASAWMQCFTADSTNLRFIEAALRCAPGDTAAMGAMIRAVRSRDGPSVARETLDRYAKAPLERPELLLLRAELSLELGDFEGALAGLPSIPPEGPEGRRAAWMRVDALVSLGRTEEASPELLRLTGDAPSAEVERLQRAAETWETIDPRVARRLRHRIAALAPRNLANIDAWIRLCIPMEDPSERIAALEARLAIDPTHGPSWARLAEDREAAGDRAGALDAYRGLATTQPEAISLAHALMLAREAGDTERVNFFGERVAMLPPLKDASEIRALRLAGLTDRARAHLERLRAAHPNDPLLAEERFLLLDVENDPLGSAPGLDEFYQQHPDRVDVAIARAHCYAQLAREAPEGSTERLEHAQTALSCWERCLTLETPTPERLREMARLERLLGHGARALERYRQLVAMPGGDALEGITLEYAQALLTASAWSELDHWLSPRIRAHERSPPTLWAEVEALTHLHRSEAALELLESLLASEPENPLYLRRKGELLLETGRRVEAMAAFRRAVQAAEGDPRTRWAIGEALRAQGAYLDAIEAYREGLSLAPRDRRGRLALGETLLLSGQAAAAFASADDLLHEDTEDLGAWRLRADAARALEKADELLYSLTALRRLAPQDRALIVELARCQADAGAVDEAFDELSHLEAPATPGTDWAQVCLLRGDLGLTLGRFEEAQKSLETAVQIDRSLQASVALRLARARLRAGRPDLALSTLDEASIGEGSTEGWQLRAEILTALERPSEARAAYTAWLAHDPGSPTAREGVARSLLDEGRASEALEFLQAQIAQGSPTERLYLLWSEAESALGHPEAAIAAIERGLAAFPEGPALWGRRGELAIRREDWSTASRAFAQALRSEPKNAEWLCAAASASQKQGRLSEAVAFLTTATETAGDRPALWAALGSALLADHRPVDALTSFERARQLDPTSEAARDGIRLAQEKLQMQRVERFAREGALLEARLGRPVTKNDLLVQLQVPLESLDAVMDYLGRSVPVDLHSLTPAEWEALESASFRLIVAALERRPAGIERRGLTLADVAVLSPPTAKLSEIQQLFGYVRAVLEADMDSDLPAPATPVEPLVRKALELPPEQRTLFGLVRQFGIGLYLARLIQQVDQTGGVSHPSPPPLDLGHYSPEFQAPPAETEGGERFFEPEVPASPALAPSSPLPRAHEEPPMPPALGATKGTARCLGCGGIAKLHHACGAPICSHCIEHFGTCPKCGSKVSVPPAPPQKPPSKPPAVTSAPRSSPKLRAPLRDFHSTGADSRASASTTSPPPPPVPPHPTPPRTKASTTNLPSAPPPSVPAKPVKTPEDASAHPAAPKPAERPPRRRPDPTDDEPRL